MFTVLPVMTIIASCGLKEMKRIELPQATQMQDSVAKLIPGYYSGHVMQDDDFSKVVIIVGAPGFYDASADMKQLAAIRTGIMLLNVLGPDLSITNATLVITKKDNNDNKIPEDGISLDMKIDSLKKVMFPK